MRNDNLALPPATPSLPCRHEHDDHATAATTTPRHSSLPPQDEDGLTAFELAKKDGQTEIAQLLSPNGSRKSVKGGGGGDGGGEGGGGGCCVVS